MDTRCHGAVARGPDSEMSRAAITNRVEDERKGGRVLAAARIVEVIGGPRRRPVGENPEQPALLYRSIHLVFRKIGKA